MLKDLKEFINKYLEPKVKIKDLYFKDGKLVADYYDGEIFVFIELENGKVIRENVTNEPDIDIVNHIIVRIACLRSIEEVD